MHEVRSFALSCCVAALFGTLLGSPPASAQQYQVLHQFQGSISVADGYLPVAGVSFDQDGNLYGTTQNGGGSNCGIVFKIGRRPSGAFRNEQILHRFDADNDRGCGATGGVAVGPNGELYGTAIYTSGHVNNYGVAFRLASADGIRWKKTLLHSFAGPPNDGALPQSDLLLHPDGAIYGVTTGGGNIFGLGSVFRITISPRGVGHESVLHDFQSSSGTSPFRYGSLAVDGDGALYGTTIGGGGQDCNCGVIFKLTPKTTQHTLWKYAVLYRFKNVDETPTAGLAIGSDGSLYGTSAGNGSDSGGAVFRLSPPAPGKLRWTKRVLYKFPATDPTAGVSPLGPLTIGPDGSLYGTTFGGGDHLAGTVFKVSQVGGTWGLQYLHIFSGGFGAPDGKSPTGRLVFGPDGALYGTTQEGGSANGGTVFRVEP